MTMQRTVIQRYWRHSRGVRARNEVNRFLWHYKSGVQTNGQTWTVFTGRSTWRGKAVAVHVPVSAREVVLQRTGLRWSLVAI